MIPNSKVTIATLILSTAVFVRSGKHETFGLKRSLKKTSASGIDDSRDQPSQDESCGSSFLRCRSSQFQSMATNTQLRKQTPEENRISSNSLPPVPPSEKNKRRLHLPQSRRHVYPTVDPLNTPAGGAERMKDAEWPARLAVKATLPWPPARTDLAVRPWCCTGSYSSPKYQRIPHPLPFARWTLALLSDTVTSKHPA